MPCSGIICSSHVDKTQVLAINRATYVRLSPQVEANPQLRRLNILDMSPARGLLAIVKLTGKFSQK